MRAAARIVQTLAEVGQLPRTARIEAHRYGSLTLTGKGHGTELIRRLPTSIDKARNSEQNRIRRIPRGGPLGGARRARPCKPSHVPGVA
ncbi:MAG: serine dehydratase beta chain [Thermoguttaceae bacterium]